MEDREREPRAILTSRGLAVSGFQNDWLEGEVVEVRHDAERDAFDTHPGFEIVVTDGTEVADRHRENEGFTADSEMGELDLGNRLASIDHLHFLVGVHRQTTSLQFA